MKSRKLEIRPYPEGKGPWFKLVVDYPMGKDWMGANTMAFALYAEPGGSTGRRDVTYERVVYGGDSFTPSPNSGGGLSDASMGALIRYICSRRLNRNEWERWFADHHATAVEEIGDKLSGIQRAKKKLRKKV